MIKKFLLTICLLALPLQVWGATSWEQTHFRFRNDDGSESAATWKANANTNYTQDVTNSNANLRIRIGVKETGTTAAALTGRLYVSKNGGAYAQASSTSTGGCKVIDSANLTDNDATTQQLTSGTFVAGKVDDVNGQCTATSNLSQNNVTEHEYMLQLDWANLVNGDYFEFRERNSTTALGTYTQTGRITVNKIGNNINTLYDNFNDNSIDAAKWGTYNEGGTTTETNNQIEFTSDLSGGYNALLSVNSYDLTSSSVTVKVIDVGNQSLSSFGFYILCLGNDYYLNNNRIFWGIQGGILYANDEDGNVGTLSYSSIVHIYFRIRESDGITYWDYSTNGIEWTNAFSKANASAVTAKYVGNFIYSTAEASTTTAKVDSFNLLPESSVLDRTKAKLLCHFNGANGATTYTSDDASARTATFAGSAQLSTTQKKFGTASLLLASATSDYLTFPDSDDWVFGTGDFEVGIRGYFNSLPSSGSAMAILDQYVDSTNKLRVMIYNEGGVYQWELFIVSGGVTLFDYYPNTSPNLSTGSFFSLAISRSNGTFYFFSNGILIGQTTTAVDIPNFASVLYVGRNLQYGDYFDGYIDELYIINGQALHTSMYEPLDVEYSLSAAAGGYYTGRSIGVGITRGVRQ